MQLAPDRDSGRQVEENRATRHGKTTVKLPKPPTDPTTGSASEEKAGLSEPMREIGVFPAAQNSQNYDSTE